MSRHACTRQVRPPPGDARPPRPEDPRARGPSRLRDCPAHRGELAGAPPRSPGLALSGAPPAREPRVARGELDPRRIGSGGEGVPADEEGPGAARAGGRRLATAGRRDRLDFAGGGDHGMNWLRRLLSRGRLERELERELAFHVERLEEDLAAKGMPAAEARRQALLRFGGLESVKEAARDARGTRWIESLAGDVRYAFRTMARAKAFTLAAILSLALGVGANTSVFGVIQALLLRT